MSKLNKILLFVNTIVVAVVVIVIVIAAIANAWTSPSVNPPTGSGTLSSMIVLFAGPCPTGWTEYTAARGRTVVGTPSGGTSTGTVGTAFTNLANRTITNVPSHFHAVDPPNTGTSGDGGHTHSYEGWNWAGTHGGAGDWPAQTAGSRTTGGGGSHSHTVDIASFNSGTTGSSSVDVTMPYIQLTYCQKN